MLAPIMPTTPTNSGMSARHRIAWRLLPFLFLLYVVNYLDRTNISYATLGMKGDLRLTDEVFGTASGIFFLGYLLLQIPGALLMERWSPRLLLAITLIAWGGLTVLTGFVRTPVELYGARFLLGVAEAAFFPGIVVYLSHWFIDRDRATALARFMAAIPIGYILGGPLAGALLKVNWLGSSGWRWLFFLEGAPAIFFGIATFFVLPDRPDEARWLRKDERDWLASRLDEERRSKAMAGHTKISQALRQRPVVLLSVGLFFCYSGGYAFWFWMPTMLQRLTGWSDVQQIGWIGSIPFVVGLIGMLLIGWNSDRTGERRWHFAIPQMTAAAALGAWFLVPHSNITLVVIFSLVVFGTSAYLPAFWALPSSFLGASNAAAVIGFISCIASIGGFIGPKLIGTFSQRTGSFDAGFLFMIACWVIAAVFVLLCPRVRAGSVMR